MMKDLGRVFFGLVAFAALASPLAAKDKDKGKNGDPLKETVAAISSALAKNDADAAQAGFARAEGLRQTYDDKKLAPVVKAIGKGVTHKNGAIATAAVETLGKLKVKGSSKLLGKLINPPAKVKDEQVAAHQAAIQAAGAIHDVETLKSLEKLLLHANADIATTAAEALVGYKVLDLKPKEALVKRLVATLAKLEKAAAAKKSGEGGASAEKTCAALATTLAGLTGKEGLSKSSEWSAWLKEQKKKS